jgi:putative transposase
VLKAYKYQVYPTEYQRQVFNDGIFASSIYFNFILAFYKTAFDNNKEFSYLSLKSTDDKSRYIDIIKDLSEKRDKDNKLIEHNEWARDLINDTEYHSKLFFKRNGDPKGSWVDVAEVCATYTIEWHRKRLDEGKVTEPHPLLKLNRGALQMAREAVKNAIKKFWLTRTKEKPMKGFPNFKSAKNPNRSFQFSPNFKITFDFDNRSMHYTSKKWDIGHIKIGKGRIPPKQSIYRTITINRTTTNKFFISVLVDDNILVPDKKIVDNVVGIDIGFTDRYASLSNGDIIKATKKLRTELNKLAHLQRLASKKIKKNIKGHPLPNKHQSSNYFKANRKVSKHQEKIKHFRENYLHHITNNLIKSEFDTFAVETLSIKDMMITDDNKITNKQKNNINRNIADASIYTFIAFLTYKAQWTGKNVIKVDKYFPSSQLCSCCGYKNPEVKDLTIREWICPKCNTTHDRDINAAINLRTEGIKIAYNN